jgi:hypothetical protein
MFHWYCSCFDCAFLVVFPLPWYFMFHWYCSCLDCAFLVSFPLPWYFMFHWYCSCLDCAFLVSFPLPRYFMLHWYRYFFFILSFWYFTFHLVSFCLVCVFSGTLPSYLGILWFINIIFVLIVPFGTFSSNGCFTFVLKSVSNIPSLI